MAQFNKCLFEQAQKLYGGIGAMNTVPTAKLNAAIEAYLAEHPVQTPVDATLTKRGEAADAATVGQVREQAALTIIELQNKINAITGLPAVTADDNDKVLQVVDGVWTTVALADSAIGAYIDNYISSALEGEY